MEENEFRSASFGDTVSSLAFLAYPSVLQCKINQLLRFDPVSPQLSVQVVHLAVILGILPTFLLVEIVK